MKVVYLADLLFNGTCQKPALASILLKTVAPASMPRVCSTEDRMNFSLQTGADIQVCVIHADANLLLDLFWHHHHSSTPIRGSSILVITPISSIRSNSSFTFDMSGRGTLRGVWRERRAQRLASI